ncbi:unnamed protein product [Polarella glacialis]|uniref:Protein kinase domain-containing protein n=1 Tax=Polarella glacialis TaxID=89957 RepID=A0A813GYT4_POLGL|nr:unnamed protein product [Polarella glacialis]CAE8646801.1 unnamed protein product [Polarella glacialis]
MVIRIRSMGMQNIIFKGFPIILGLPNKHLFLCVLLMCLGDTAAQFWLLAINSKATAAETATGHYMAIVYFGVIACAIGVAKNILLRRLYDTQIQPEVENEGIETLFSSVGDFVIWLEKDGGKIHRSHFRFDSLLGRKMESEQFSSCLSNAEENLRYENYMRSVGTGQGTAPAPVMKLSLRLNAAEGSVVDMDFFIVDRRATRHPTTDQEGSFGFLLGGCFTQDRPSFSPLAGSNNNNDNNNSNNNNNDNTSLPASDDAAELAAMTSFELMLELPQIDAIREEPCDGENSGEELALELQTAERPNQGRPGPTPSAAPSMASRMSSLPGTEVMFEALSQAVEGDVDKDVLWQIASLGVAEHWLIAVGSLTFPSGDALKILGDGGFGVVLAAHICGTKVAVKTPREGHMHGSALRSMANKLRVLRHVRHPNIVLFFGAVIHPDSHVLWLVFEFVSGTVLDRYVLRAEAGKPGSQARWLILEGVSRALRYLHEQRTLPVVHGDVKPNNIMVESWRTGPRAKSLDFGMSRLLSDRTSKLGGSLCWVAPEVFHKTTAWLQAPATDVFSFGRITYYLSTGKEPFRGMRSNEIKAVLMEGSAQLPWDGDDDVCVAPACRSLCDACQHLDPSQRPSMAQVHAALLGFRQVLKL